MSDENWKRYRAERQCRTMLTALLMAIFLLPLYKISQAVSYDRVGTFSRHSRGRTYSLLEAPAAFYWNVGLWGGFGLMILYAVFRLRRDRA